MEKGLNNTRKALVLLSIVAVAAMVGSFALTTYASDDSEESAVPYQFGWRFGGRFGDGYEGRNWGRHGFGRFGFIEVSEEFEAKAITIAEGDEDVQGLLSDGYSVTGVNPIIKTIVDGNGDFETKATGAIVMLENEDATGHASAWVEMEEGIVTKIVILTRTVIEKT